MQDIMEKVHNLGQNYDDIQEYCYIAASDAEDLKGEDEVKTDEDFSNMIVVENLPVTEKEEKLLSVIWKIFSQIGEVKEDGIFMPTDTTATTLGFCFIVYNTAQEAEVALEKTQNYKLDRSHIFSVNYFRDIEKFMNVQEKWALSETMPFTPGENLQQWLSDGKAMAQLVNFINCLPGCTRRTSFYLPLSDDKETDSDYSVDDLVAGEDSGNPEEVFGFNSVVKPHDIGALETDAAVPVNYNEFLDELASFKIDSHSSSCLITQHSQLQDKNRVELFHRFRSLLDTPFQHLSTVQVNELVAIKDEMLSNPSFLSTEQHAFLITHSSDFPTIIGKVKTLVSRILLDNLLINNFHNDEFKLSELSNSYKSSVYQWEGYLLEEVDIQSQIALLTERLAMIQGQKHEIEGILAHQQHDTKGLISSLQARSSTAALVRQKLSYDVAELDLLFDKWINFVRLFSV